MKVTNSFLRSPSLTEGGEGIIYELNGKIIKIYKKHINKSDKLKKLEYLLKVNLPSNVVKPIDLVYDENNDFIGFVMDKVSGEELSQLSNKKTIKSLGIKVKDILKVLVEVKNTLQHLHKQNIYVGDLNDCNILFDKNFNTYFIDCDSWTVANVNCNVCVDSFKDPLLVGDRFNTGTDNYAFAVMSFKSLTRIHPFGGTTNPDLSLVERMKRKISIIDNNNVIIPRVISNWKFIPPKLLNQMKDIFESTKRDLLSDNLDEFYNNLKLCQKDNEYYYSKFTTCPYCDANAKVLEKPIKVDTGTGPQPILYFTSDDIKFILTLDSYISNNDEVVHNTQNGYKIKNRFGVKVHFINKDSYIEEYDNKFLIISKDRTNIFDKKLKTSLVIDNGNVYYISLSEQLVSIKVLSTGNAINNITKCSANTIFKVAGEDYFVCSSYEHTKVIQINGNYYNLETKDRIINYGIHMDKVSGNWLFIYETSSGQFKTFIFDKNVLKFSNYQIKYGCTLSDLCFNNGTIFAPIDGFIRGFSWQKNAYKDFPCSVVTSDSRLIRDKNKFFIINDKEIYTFG